MSKCPKCPAAMKPCPECYGSGKKNSMRCPRCGGKGEVCPNEKHHKNE